MTANALAGAARRDRTAAILVALTLLALGLRIAYFMGSEVRSPIVGDIVEYWNYAWNMVHHGVFSRAAPAAAVPVADAWRSPGYPAFIALCLRLAGDAPGALVLAQWTQLLLGTLLVPMTWALARRWLPAGIALAAAAMVAVWPHLVVFASTLLSETLFALVLGASLLLAERAHALRSTRTAGAAGLVAGLATLVNPLAGLFPPVIALFLGWRRRRAGALAYLVAFLLVAGAWGVRNAGIDAADGATRARTNLVQGSWPLFLPALNDRFRHPMAKEYVDHVAAEEAAMQADPGAGLAALRERLRGEPGVYLRWYLLDKPWLLWDWSVRVGWGDIYFLETLRSPYDRIGVLRGLRATCHALNPVVFAFSVLGGLFALRHALRRDVPEPAPPGAAFAWLQLALLLAYVTAVHVVLQAEPRYAIAYRPMQFVLALAGAVAAWRWLQHRLPRRGGAAA